MTKSKAAADMSLAELEKALEGAKERLSGMEKELTDYRKSVQSHVLEFGKRQRQFEKAFGFVDASSNNGHRRSSGGGNISGGKRAARGTISESILAVLGKASKPINVNEIVSATGANSKPSVAQTLMKLVQSGKVHRYNKDGKPIPKGDDSQRAKGYAIA